MTNQQMFTDAFEKRMKAQVYSDTAHFVDLISFLRDCLHRYSVNNINLDAIRLSELLNFQGEQCTYYEAGVMIQMIKGAPLECFSKGDIDAGIQAIDLISKIDIEFSKVAEKAIKEAEREVNTKLEIMRK